MADMPIVFVSKGFENMTGYEAADVIGRNCRFLQRLPSKEMSDDNMQTPLYTTAVAKSHYDAINTRNKSYIKQNLYSGNALQTCLFNYRATGEPFVNFINIIPVWVDSLQYFVGYSSFLSSPLATGE